MPYFGYEGTFSLKAPFFCGPEFVKHLLQVFLVSVIPKPFVSYCDYRDDHLVPVLGQNTAAIQQRHSNVSQRFRWRTEKRVSSVEARNNCINLSWIFAKLPSQEHSLLSKPLWVINWNVFDIFSQAYIVFDLWRKCFIFYLLYYGTKS